MYRDRDFLFSRDNVPDYTNSEVIHTSLKQDVGGIVT